MQVLVCANNTVHQAQLTAARSSFWGALLQIVQASGEVFSHKAGTILRVNLINCAQNLMPDTCKFAVSCSLRDVMSAVRVLSCACVCSGGVFVFFAKWGRYMPLVGVHHG